jgi:NitT/TauT family transport system substrate-binding protein
MRRNTILIATLAILLLVGCGTGESGETGEAQPVKLLLTFQPNVQFAPFYVGIDKGYFAEQGLDVSIEHTSESDVVRLVAAGEADFGIVSGEQVILARAQEVPIVYVYEWFHQFPVAVASKPEAGITSAAGLAGHTVGVPLLEGASYIGIRALMSAAGLSDADVSLEATGYTQVETLLADRVDAVVVYANNEPLQLAAQGIDATVIPVTDYIDLVSNGLIVSEDTISDNPDLVRAMDAALQQSVQYAVEHPDEAFEISKGYVEGLDDPEVGATQKAVLEATLALWQPESGAYGETTAASWLETQDVLLNAGLIDGPLADLEAAYSNEYLP